MQETISTGIASSASFPDPGTLREPSPSVLIREGNEESCVRDVNSDEELEGHVGSSEGRSDGMGLGKAKSVSRSFRGGGEEQLTRGMLPLKRFPHTGGPSGSLGSPVRGVPSGGPTSSTTPLATRVSCREAFEEKSKYEDVDC